MAGSTYQKRLAGPTQPGTSSTTLYTAPTSNITNAGTTSLGIATTIVKEIWLVNTTASNANVTVGINGTAAANQFVPNIQISANDAKVFSDLDLMLASGDTIQALQGTASAISVIINGVEVQ